jgi:hypothetical protein
MILICKPILLLFIFLFMKLIDEDNFADAQGEFNSRYIKWVKINCKKKKSNQKKTEMVSSI